MLTIAAGNTALQSVLPALGRSLGVADSAVAAAFSVSALLWVIAAPFWANRSDRHGRRAMVLLGVGGFTRVADCCAGCSCSPGSTAGSRGTAAFAAFIAGRLIYGAFGSAAPPAVQALVAGRTTREERTEALTLLASAFGLGTILGPAIAPYLVLGASGGRSEIGLAGPAFVFAAVRRRRMDHGARACCPRRSRARPAAHGAAATYPSIGGAAHRRDRHRRDRSRRPSRSAILDPRIRAWMITGLVMGHAQAMTGQAIGFLVIDRLALPPLEALQPTGAGADDGRGVGAARAMGADPAARTSSRARWC